MKLNPYLRFDGNCKDAFAFYKQALGAEITTIMTWGDGPMAENIPPEAHNMVMHAELDIGGNTVMGTDGGPDDTYEGIKGANVVINADGPEEAERLFKNLSEGGNITMQMEETFWALRFGMVTDKFGVPWMVNCDKPE